MKIKQETSEFIVGIVIIVGLFGIMYLAISSFGILFEDIKNGHIHSENVDEEKDDDVKSIGNHNPANYGNPISNVTGMGF